jgi:hypothetical protein
MKFEGLCKMLTDALDSESQPNEGWEGELSMCTHQPSYIPTLEYSWYNDLKKYMKHGNMSEHFNSRQIRSLRLKSALYQLVNTFQEKL